MKINFILNNEDVRLDTDPCLSTLRFLREQRKLISVKTGCGEGECGACTVILGQIKDGKLRYRNVASCLLPVGELQGCHLVTLEGVNQQDLSPVQQAFVDQGAVQCGFCTPGFIMSLTGFFLSEKELTRRNIRDSIDGNICRCTGYYAIHRAVERIFERVVPEIDPLERTNSLVRLSVVPDYFREVPDRLSGLKMEPVSPVEKPRYIAGGTDLMVGEMDTRRKDPVFVSNIPGISGITDDGESVSLGAGASVEEIKDSGILKKHFPEFENFMYLVSSQIIRNMATLGGNIVNASPIGDLSVLFLPLGAELEIKSGKNIRKVELGKFYQGYKKMDLRPGELITRLVFPVPEENQFLNFEKVSRRKFLDIASCNSAAYFKIENHTILRCAISAGGVAPIPLLLKETGAFLKGKEINRDTAAEAAETAADEASPISDVRGSADYKKRLLKTLIRAHFRKLEGVNNESR